MGRMALFDGDRLADLLTKQVGVVSRGQAKACGLSDAALRHRIRPDGPWLVLLPGTYLSHTGTPTTRQREMAAVLYAGTGGVITGLSALTWHGIRAPRAHVVDVLIPESRRRRDAGFVRLSRTRRMPSMLFPQGEVCFVPPARAVADAVRNLRDLSVVRAIVADGVQRGVIRLALLQDELAQGPVQGSARLRQVLTEVEDGVRSSVEADLRTLIKVERLPDPMYNPRLYAGEQFIAQPDTWWAEAGVAGEMDSREWHLSPRDWERTLARDARMSAHGIVVLHISPGRLKAEPRIVAAQIRSALEAGRRRCPVEVKALPAR
jgi:AbiEi antitoxin C-terminal domain